MNNLEYEEKKKRRLIEIIALIIVLNVFLILVFATTVGDDLQNAGNGSQVSTTSTQGNGSTTNVTNTTVGNPEIASVVTGANFTVALDSEGKVWSWGQNDKGQLGNGTLIDSSSKSAVLLDPETQSGKTDVQLSNIIQVAAGEYHAAALTNDGKVYMWGYNYFGQVGSVERRTELYPQLVSMPNGVSVTQIECGADYTLMLTSSGNILGIGDSSDGQLGYYNDLAFTSIRNIEDEKSTTELPTIKDISAGYNHIIALDNNGQVWTWGDTAGSGFEFTSINQVAFEDGKTIQEIKAGNGVSIALSTDGDVYTWNMGTTTATKVDLSTASGWDYTSETPTKVTLDTGVQVRTDSTKENIAVLNKTFYIIDENNKVFSWGTNSYGQTGTGTTSTVSIPTELKMDTSVEINKEIDKVTSSAVAGISSTGSTGNYDTAYAINADGYVLGWGYAGTDIVDDSYQSGSNSFKLLGDGTRYNASYIGNISVKSVTGNDIVLDITNQGIAAGNNTKDVLTMLADEGYVTGGRVNLYRFESQSIIDSLDIKSVNEEIASYDKETGYITGETIGKTSLEIKSSKNTIYLNVEVIGDNFTYPKIESQQDYTVALKADGTVWAWGYNTTLGIKDIDSSYLRVPVQVKGLENIIDISAGENFVVALKADGTVYTWGYNGYGQLGNGTTSSSSNMSIVNNEPEFAKVLRYEVDQDGQFIDELLTDIKSISAGERYVLALDNNGKVWAWGYNSYYQLGIETGSSYETRAKEVDLTNLSNENEIIKQIEAGERTSYIVTESGNVYAWGYNGYYSCGMSGNYYIPTPTKVTTFNRITKISADLNGNAFALNVNGRVWAFGYNYSSYPRVLSISNVVDIYGTDEGAGAIAIFADGTVGYWTSSSVKDANVTKLKDINSDDAMLGVTLISGSYDFYHVVKADGTVYATGRNSHGELGNRTTTNVLNVANNLVETTDVTKSYISLSENEITLKENASKEITANYNPGFNLLYTQTEEVQMQYSSLNEEIATVNGNTITAKKQGITYVIAEDPITETELRVKVNVLADVEVTMPDISIGYRHTVSLKTDGSVWGWGYNAYGALGEKASYINRPEKLAVNKLIKDVAAGDDYTLMLTTDGKVLALGDNSSGKLGNNSTADSRVPVYVQVQAVNAANEVTYEDLEGIVKIVAHEDTSMALDKDGNVYTWGYGANCYATKLNTYGIKVRDISERLILTEDGRVWEYTRNNKVEFVDGLENIVEISSSAYSDSTSYGYYMALDAKGNIYTWVRSTNSYNKVAGNETTIPTKVEFDENVKPEDVKIVNIEAGVKVAYAKDENGNVYTWGSSANRGTLGLGESISSVSNPTQIETIENAEILATSKYSNSYSRTLIENTTGSVYGFGNNGGSYNLFGNSDSVSYYYEPKLIGESFAGFVDENGNEIYRISIEKGKTADIQAGLMSSFNLRSLTLDVNNATTEFEWDVFNSDLISLSNTTGARNTLTANSIIGEATIVAIDKITGKMAKLYVDVVETDTLVAPKVESVNNHTVALKADGTVWVWGYNGYNQLGIRGKSTVTEPTQLRIAKQVPVTAPIEKINPDGTNAVDENERQIYVDADGNEYLQIGDNYTDLSGTLAIKMDIDGTLYNWDASENRFALEDILDENGDPIIVVDIATSNYHTLLLTDSGEVYSCGYNWYGQLGHSSTAGTNYSYLPVKVDALSDIVKIAVGDTYSLALDKYGKIWGFGYLHLCSDNNYRYCENIINGVTPTRIEKIRKVDITQYAKDAIDITNEYILTKDGEVISLGFSRNTHTVGTKIEGITGKVIKITRTSGNKTSSATRTSGHTAFLTEEGNVFTIGYGTYGQLGNDYEINSLDKAVQVVDDQNEEGYLSNIRDVYTGENHTMAINKDGNLYTWGNDQYGQLRTSGTIQESKGTARPYKVKSDDRIGKILVVSGGNQFTVVADETGYVFAWGQGTSSQLGNKLTVNSKEAVRVGVEGISLNKNHVTLKENGASIEIGGTTNLLNLLYDQDIEINSVTSNNSSVVTVSKIDGHTAKLSPVSAGTTSVIVTSKLTTGKVIENIVQVTVLPKEAEIAEDIVIPTEQVFQPMTVSGYSHTLILKADGTVWAYGENTYGQTGNVIKYSDKATKVEFPEGTPSIVGIAAGDSFSVALDVNGSVYTWGYNRNGQLGQGSSDSSVHANPTKVSGLSNIVKVVAGSNHVLAIDANGYVYTWGKNTKGSLGIGSNSDVYVPTKIDNIVGAIDIAAGSQHSMILTTNGDVYTTGGNEVGQLGIGETRVYSKLSFEKITIDEKIAYIEAGDRASIVIDINGKVWAWGNNENGQLGLGIDDTKVYVPTKVTSISEKVSSASVGENHIHLVTNSGKLYTAGSNKYGQLGIGNSKEISNTFVQVTSGVMNSDAGTTYSTYIANDGTVYGFGDYNHGNLERTSLTSSFTPVMISENIAYLDEYEVVLNLNDENNEASLPETYQINPNGRYKLNVLHKDNSTFTYEATNSEIAKVNEEGLITAVSIGTTTVKVTENETGKVNVMTVKVVPFGATQAPSVEAGDKFAVVTDQYGTSYLFGNKEYIAKTNVPSITNNSIVFKVIRAGKDFVIGLNNDQTVWAWGNNANGQLGLEDIENSDKMLRLNRNEIKDIVQIDAGDKHAIALDNLGVVYVWGDNANGQLGIAVTADTQTIKTPTVIRPVTGRVISVSAGGDYSAIVDTTGTAYILRNGNAYSITGVSGAVKVATGKDYTLILNNQGKVYKVTNKPIANVTWLATEITMDKTIVDITVNDEEFMCLASDKTLYTFGNNTDGQLGAASTESAINTPVKVAEDVFTMGAGYNNTYYIHTNGEVFAAGLNTSGEIGNGTSDKIERSNTYLKVGNSAFELDPETLMVSIDWKVLVGDEELKELVTDTNKTEVAVIEKRGEFNVFGNKIVDLSEYEFTITDTDIAEITDETVLEITAKDYGTTYLNIVNKVTKEENKLKILVVSEDLLRIKDLYVEDTKSKFKAVPESITDNKPTFLINTEGSEASGTLNIKLKYNDAIKVLDEEGNELTVTFNQDTQMYTINGLNLDKSLQKLTIILTDTNEKEYTYNIIIYKEIIIKVNDELLSMEKVINQDNLEIEKVFTKYINPEDEKAKVEISIDNEENKIQLEDESGNVLKTTNPGEELNIEVDTPNIQNTFIVKILNSSNKTVKEYKLKILKSSIISVHVKDIKENPTQILAERSEGTTYLEEFYVEINEVNNPAEITVKFGNKHVTKVLLDGVDVTSYLNNGTLKVSKELPTVEGTIVELPLVVYANDKVDYTETYLVKINQISSNNNIEKIILTYLGSTEYVRESVKATDDAIIHEISLHDKTAVIDLITYKVMLESTDAQFSINGGATYKLSGATVSQQVSPITENKYGPVKILVKAENGDIKEHTLYIYKESENADIDKISVKNIPNGRIELATRTLGTNSFIGKVLKDQDSYEFTIDCFDDYSTIESITIDGEETSLIQLKTSKDGTYTYSADKEIINKPITIVVKPEYDGAPSQTYTLTLVTMDDDANFGEISVDGNVLDLLDENGKEKDDLSVTIKATDKGILKVISESEKAKVTIIDEKGQTIISDENEVTTAIPFNGQKTVKLTISVTSEDGITTKTKKLTVTRLSNNANILSIELGKYNAKQSENNDNVYTIDIPESLENGVIKVTPEDTNATILIDGKKINGTSIDLNGLDKITITVKSEDGTVEKEYTLKINKLSSDASFTMKLKSEENGNIVKQNNDFVKDTTNENQYNVTVKDNLGNLILTITPNNSKTKVKMAISKVGTTEVPEANRVFVENDLPLSADESKEIIVKMTPEDGITKEFIIKMTSKHQILKNVTVAGTKGESKELTSAEIKALFANVRVHPDSTKATVTIKTDYTPVGLIATISHPTMKDEFGNDIKEYKIENKITSSSGISFDVTLLEDAKDEAIVSAEMTTADGETEILTLKITKGSTKAKLEKVTVTGKTTQTTVEANYEKVFDNTLILNTDDEKYNLNAICAENGSAKIYQLSGDVDWKTVDLATQSDITSNAQVTLTEEPIEFVILVTSEYDSNTERYRLILRKIGTDANLTNFTLTINDTITRNLSNFGNFTYNKEEDVYEIKVYVPVDATKASISNLVVDSNNATTQWADINSTNYIGYVSGTEKLVAKGNMYIKVTAENGNVKTYKIVVDNVNNNTTLNAIKVYNVTEKKYEVIKDYAVTILDTVKDIKIEAEAKGAISLKVLQVNGHNIIEKVTTEKPILSKNTLNLNLEQNYTYTDDEGNINTIPASEIKSIVVETTVVSNAYYLYPEYYTGDESEYTKKYNLTITREITDVGIKISIDNNGNTITYTSNNFGDPVLENDKIVRKLKINLPSKQEKFIIKGITANSIYATILHRQKSGNKLYTETPFERAFTTLDTETFVEEITVKTDAEQDTVYRLTIHRQSGKNDIGKVTVNDCEAKREENTDIFNITMLSPVETLDIKAFDIEKNATVKLYISKINDVKTDNMNLDKTVVYSDVKNDLKDISKELAEQLTKILNNKNIARNDIESIVINIEVQSEDTTISARVYTLNITVKKAYLISISGLDKNGNVGVDNKLKAGDFNIVDEANGIFETSEIVIPRKTRAITLSDIIYNDELGKAIITNENGEEIESILIELNGVEKITQKIFITVGEMTQEYNIKIRKALTETGIKDIIVDGNLHKEIDNGVYIFEIKDTSDPKVEVTLVDSNAKVLKAKVNGTEISNIINNTFTINGLAANTHNDLEDKNSSLKEVFVTITVQAEDKDTKKEYQVKLIRKHTSTVLKDITITYGNETETMDYTKVSSKTKVIPSSVEEISITNATLECAKAKVYVQYTDELGTTRKELLDTSKIYSIPKDITKVFKLIVEAEYGNTKEYTLNIKRKSSDVSVKSVTVTSNDKDFTATYNQDSEIYAAIIRVDKDATIKVELTNEKAKVKKVIIPEIYNGVTASTIEDNTFDIIGLSNLSFSDDNDVNRVITIQFVVQAEDEDVTKTYTLQLTRKHVDTTLKDISYGYIETVTDETGTTSSLNKSGTLTLTKEDDEKEITVGSSVSQVEFEQIIASCNKAQVNIEVDGKTVTQTEDGFSINLDELVEGDGCIKTVNIKVTSESGDEKTTYTIEIIREAKNASLGKVYVKGQEATREEASEVEKANGIEAIYRANINNTDKTVNIKAISANKFAIVTINNVDNDSNEAIITYDLSTAIANNDREVEILIVVTPQDSNVEPKTYKLILTRQYTSTILDQIVIKPTVDNLEDEKIVIQDNDKHTADFKQNSYTHYRYGSEGQVIGISWVEIWYTTEVEIPTEWSNIKFTDILPGIDEMNVTITQIDSERAHYARQIGEEIEVDEAFEVPEGKKVYIKVVTKAESGATSNPYVITLYKKATSTKLTTLRVNSNVIQPDVNDGIYRANISVDDKNATISITGENNLDIANTKITKVVSNGKEIDLTISKSTSGTISKNIGFSLKELNKLDPTENKVITLTISVQPEDLNIAPKEYTVEITRIHSSADIKQVLGNDNDIPVDKQKTHYEYIGKAVDDSIYTYYIDENATEVTTDIIAESLWAEIYLNEDYDNSVGTGKVEDYKVQITDTFTEVKVRIVSEDKLTAKDYRIWFIRKSDDASIANLWVDGNALTPNEDGNYEYVISDTVEKIHVKMLPSYEFANVSINSRPYKWREVEETINGINNYVIEDGKVKIELRVQIPREQNSTGELILNEKFLYITRVSTENTIDSITTDNDNDKTSTYTHREYYNETWGTLDTFSVLLEATGEIRDIIDLCIEPTSPMAAMELYDLEGNLLASSKGKLLYEDLPVDEEDITTVVVKVIPEQGNAKEYYIEITPKSSQAELEWIKMDNVKQPELIPGKYDYLINNIGLTGIGTVEAQATDSEALVNIYTIEYPNGSGEQKYYASLGNIDFDNATFVSITVISPNRKNTNTYTLWLKDVSDERRLATVTYNDGIEVAMKASSDKTYMGEYTIELEPEQNTIDVVMTAVNEKAYVEVEDALGKHQLTITKDLSSMDNDIVLDIIVTAESGNYYKYKLTIKKRTIITGKVVTENSTKVYENETVQILDDSDNVVATGKTDIDGTFEIDSVPAGNNYKLVVKKDGYLTYTITDIPVEYGVRRYVRTMYLIAGEVSGNDEYIDLRDLVQVNKRARISTLTSDTDSKYDFNEDGVVDNLDLNILIKNYDKTAIEHSTFKFVRSVNILGEVLDETNKLVEGATVEIGMSTTTNAKGEFKLENVEIGTYTLVVKDSSGKVIGSEAISIVEGDTYTVSNNVITIDKNTYSVDLTVRVNGNRAVVSKRGEESDEDITNPEVEFEGEITEDGVKLTAKGKDANLSKFTFYSVDESGNKAKLYTEGVNVTEKKIEKVIDIDTEFSKKYKFEVVVEDSVGNKTTKTINIQDNLIKSETDLVTFSNIVNNQDKNIRNNYEKQTIKLVVDLDLSNTNITQIGSSSGKSFKGTFDGCGHTITNINIDFTSNYGGLFGYVNEATIKNVGIESGNITSTKNYVAGLVGYAKNTTIENCYNKANVKGNNFVAGIVGYATDDTKVENCYNAGNIEGNSSIGGIVGKTNKNEILDNCYNIGTISGVTGVAGVGEIIGNVAVDITSTEVKIVKVTNCYYLGTVAYGEISQDASVTDEDRATIIAGAKQIDKGTLLNDLGDKFKADTENLNNGYPVLKWQQASTTGIALLSMTNSELTLPVSTTYTITSEFGTRIDPVTGEEGDKHYGMDIASNYQDAILAIADGTVTFAGENGGYGYCIEIKHNINGETVYSFYAHLNRIDVQVGDTVVKGQQIGLEGGKVGDPGAGSSTGIHLHLEIRKISGSYLSAVNPRNYLSF